MNRFVDLSSSSESSDPDTQVAKAEEQKRRELSDWTGVKSRDQFLANEPTVTNIAVDLRVLLSEKVTVPSDMQTEQMVLFDPEAYKGKEQELMAEGEAPTEEQLIDYGRTVSQLRVNINNKAEMMEVAEIQRGTTELLTLDADAIKLKRTYTPLKEKKSNVYKHQGVE